MWQEALLVDSTSRVSLFTVRCDIICRASKAKVNFLATYGRIAAAVIGVEDVEVNCLLAGHLAHYLSAFGLPLGRTSYTAFLLV